MKFIHTADWHLGKVVHQKSMIEDQEYMLNQLLEIIQEQEIKTLVVAGDVYDRSIPPAEAIAILDNFLNKAINKYHLTILMISGNHDHAGRLEFASNILNSQGLYIVGSVHKKIKKITLTDEHGPINFYLLPFFKPSLIKYDFEFSEVHDFNDAMAIYLDLQDINQSQRNVLITHQFVSGHSDVIESESEMPLSVGGSSQIGVDLFSGFDYVALGHLHAPQAISRESIRYSGSLLKYSVDEAFHNKSISVVNLQEKGNLSVSTIPLHAKRDIVVIKGIFSEILTTYEYSEDYVAIELLDDTLIMDAMDQLRNIFPNCLTINYTSRIQVEEMQLNTQSIQKATDYLTIFKEFYENNYQDEPSVQMIEIMSEVIEKAKEKFDETR